MADLKIAVCTVTYKRPALLGQAIWCFEQQTYANRTMVILDDSGELPEREGDGWRIVRAPERYPTLGAKRNACARLAPPDADVLVVWDDDDLYLPWGLEATAAACRRADWSRPSEVCLLTANGCLWRIKSHSEGRNDKANQCSWGVAAALFWSVGGYNEAKNQGEDADLARKLLAAGASEADPITVAPSLPWYIWGPHGNRHISEPGMSYESWEPGAAGEFAVKAPRKLDLHRPRWLPQTAPSPRPWQEDWHAL